MGLVWGTINLEGEKRMFLMDDCEILMIKKWLLRVVSESNTQTSPSLNYYILQFYICKISISETETIVMIQFEIF